MVLVLHAAASNAGAAEQYYGWDALADQYGFVVVYPDGLQNTWNAHQCCGYALEHNIDDVSFLTGLATQIGAQYAVDQKRLYVTGVSNGGMMAYTLACETDLFAAIGPVAATRLGDCNHPAPTSVIHIHGLADPIIRFDGLPGIAPLSIQGRPVMDLFAEWQKTDRCLPPAWTAAAPTMIGIAHCPDGRAVELIGIANFGHSWPVAADGIDATPAIWEFFRSHPKA